jgi:undecaprenyl-diphosphatase
MNEINYIQILILALIQGAAELLPVSSSAHVILAAKLMHLEPKSPQFIFLLVMLHTGTMFAVIYYFWPRWRWLFSRNSNSPPTTQQSPHSDVSRGRFLMMIVLATTCTGVLGYGLKVLIEKVVLIGMLHREKAEVEDLFESLPLIAASLFVVGILIIVSGLAATRRLGGMRVARAPSPPMPPSPSPSIAGGGESMAPHNTTAPLSARASIWIGLIQGLCLPFRGFSRSGATISTALLCGVERKLAEDFSFALAVVLTPPVIVRALYRLLRDPSWTSETRLIDLIMPGLVGMVFSFAAGFLALKLLSAALDKGRWQYFGYYCILASLVVLAAAFYGY